MTTYDDANRKVTVANDLYGVGDGLLQEITHYDQLGRAVLVQQSDGSPLSNDQAGIKAKTTYIEPLGSGKRVVSSTPYRNTDFSDATMQWTCAQYDRLGRVTAVAKFKGNVEPSDCESTTNRTGITRTEYFADASGFWTVVTDPTGKKRKTRSDALGRLKEVVEDPDDLNYQTTYEYDPLNNLLSVTQGVQSRTYSYSSLGRLLNASNPESGTISYTYYDSGDLLTRTDARGVTTGMTYDALHRITTKTYSDGTPTVTYGYYTTNNTWGLNIGRLQSVESSVATSNNYSYDMLGKVVSSRQTMHTAAGDLDYDTGYGWWLNGSLGREVYPSGKLVDYYIDGAGRTNKVIEYSGYPKMIYADLTNITNAYAPDGRIAKMKLGNNLWATMDYQTPGTATVYKLGTALNLGDLLQLDYTFHSTSNNGNVISQNITRGSGSWHQEFQYDGLNRLMDAMESNGFHQQYVYDRYGNRTVNYSSGLAHSDPRELNSAYNASNNRLISNQSGELTYDTAGNQTNYGSFNLSYDAENRIKTFADSTGSGEYYYDGLDKRVKKVWTPNGGSPITTYYIYDAFGQLETEISDVETTNIGITWMFTDMLGSVRAVTSEAGESGYGDVAQCSDYLPFGRKLSSSDNGRGSCHESDPDNLINSEVPQGFTGKERDPETGLDYFGARYYSAAQGRFSSTDPFNPILEMTNEEGFYAYISQPQNWNRYAYTWNNPLRFIDPSGKLVELMGDSTLQAKEKARIEAMIGGITLEYDVVGSHTYLKYTGTQQLGHFGQMLTGAQTIEFTISDTYKTKYGSGFSVFSKGGGVTVGSHESDNGHIQIFVMNKAGDRATEVGRGRLMWTCSSDGGPLYFTNDIVDAHEFGHAWGEFWGGFYIGGDYSYVTNLSAIAWENLARRRYKVQGNPAYQNYRKWHNPNLWRPPNDPPGY